MSYRWLGADLSSLRENAVLAGEVRPRSDQEAAPARRKQRRDSPTEVVSRTQ